MLVSQIIMVALLYYQVTMPSVENGKFSFNIVNGQVVRMNTQNGLFEKCDENLKCEKIEPIKTKSGE